ncbi:MULTISPECIES: transketolase C-terminal domain-containing protein [unclassified Sphingomonas]|uniref:transketolase family protein n=3 Tax=Pseudomonadota TaxID=1224 RepID=UPI000AAC777A|nr:MULTISPECIES: transketolase C-terminal domain-containing protein [unclassified Sphingomonas]
MRNAFIDELCLLAEEDESIVLLCGDLGFSVLERFSERFPDRYYNVGIAEQNMLGLAAGLAMTGWTVITYSIANFGTVRSLEQLRNDVCYHDRSVICVSVGTGAAYGSQGYTHHGIEDLGFLKMLPNIEVASPGDAHEVRWALRHLVERRRPGALRLGRGGEPLVHQGPIAEATLAGALAINLGGADVRFLSTGAILPEVVAAAESLGAEGFDVGVVSVPFVTALDEDIVANLLAGTRLMVTVEEHLATGGLGGVVAEFAASMPSHPPVLRRGIAHPPPKVALDQNAMRKHHGFDRESLITLVRSHLGTAAKRS